MVIRALILTFITLSFSGCGEEGLKYAKVEGTVTVDGKPAQTGTVLFVPQQGTEGGVSSGTITKDGTYTLVGPKGKGVVVGTHKILVQCPMEGSGPDSGQDPQQGAPPCIIPAKYANERSSDITKEVTEGENKIDIQLTSG